MKISKRQLNEIIELVHDWSDFEVEVTGYRDYDVVPYIDKMARKCLLKEVNKVLKPAKWLRFLGR